MCPGVMSRLFVSHFFNCNLSKNAKGYASQQRQTARPVRVVAAPRVGGDGTKAAKGRVRKKKLVFIVI